MRYFAACVLVIAWGLWLGGLAAVMVSVQTLFKEFPRTDVVAVTAAAVDGVTAAPPAQSTAGRGAAAIFRSWGLVELGIGAAALIAAVAVRLMTPAKPATWLFVLLALSAISAAATTGILTPKIDALRLAGSAQTPEFKQLHQLSTQLFMGRTVLLLIGGALLPTILARHATSGGMLSRERGTMST